MLFPLTYLYLSTFVLAIIVTTNVALTLPAGHGKRSLVIGGVLVAAWGLIDTWSNMATTTAQVETLSIVSAPVWAMLPYFVLRAVLLYTMPRRMAGSLLVNGVLVLPGLASIGLVVAGLLNVSHATAAQHGGYFYTTMSPWQGAVASYIVVYSALAIGALWWSVHRDSTMFATRSGKVFVGGAAVVAVCALVFNGGLVFFGIEIPYLGSVFATAFAVGFSMAAWRLGAFVPIAKIRQQRDRAVGALSRTESVLAEVPMGLAIGRAGTVLYANPVFRKLTSDESVSSSFEAIRGQLSEGARDLPGVFEPSVVLNAEQRDVIFDGSSATMVILRDVSAERSTSRELELKRQQLAKAEKLEVVGRLAGGVAHDFNNLLAIISCHADLLRDVVPRGSEADHDIDGIVLQTKRGASLSKRLLGFSSHSGPTRGATNLRAILTDLRVGVERLLGAQWPLEITGGDDPVWVMIDPVQFEQIVFNLGLNARDAQPTGGPITLDLSEGDDRVARLVVTDRGCGVPAELRERVFEPFFTTKGSLGAGLGLASVKASVEAVGGSVSLDSEMSGTAVSVSLPTTPAPPHRDAPEAALAGSSGASAVLIVDGEPLLRAGIRRIVERCGYAALEAVGPSEALPAIQNGLNLSLMVTGTRGHGVLDMLHMARQERPNMAVLLLTDLPEHPDFAAVSDAQTSVPFDNNDLVATIKRLVETPRRR